jgi:hypothetical protein
MLLFFEQSIYPILNTKYSHINIELNWKLENTIRQNNILSYVIANLCFRCIGFYNQESMKVS